MLYDTAKERIYLNEELALVEDYIELEKIRHKDQLIVDFKKQIVDTNALITPLLLLPLIENTFRNSVNENTETVFIKIELLEQNGELCFKIENNNQSAEETGPGDIGLNNVKRQLEITYSKFSLDMTRLKNSFNVTLNLNLNSYGAL